MQGAARETPRPRRRAALALVVGSLLSVTAGMLVSACGSDVTGDPSYLLVELAPVESPAKPGAARVVVTKGTAEIAALCVNLAGDNPASFVLKRDAGKPATDRINIEVLSFATLKGQENAGPGKEFACPPTLPPTLGDVQTIDVDFCEGQTRKLVFQVGSVCGCEDADAGPGDDAGDAGESDAGESDGGDVDAGPSCGCAPGFSCGVGLTTTGATCAPSTCCGAKLSSACALGS
ncbi:hypothetical protein [Polyangium jinanense]|uniref:Uncharacterized protein n=1 Tax=Polyangium jinanense TaxID=2829994 RepID=A0A9X4AUJ4_9BACT|nr:hypothetical protein [Polyangium jinanense]MDC3958348.1 hypothetical protein [Polyangium jinanense]MDC3983317.1 hypothetical protein [Polyangium jinanense]